MRRGLSTRRTAERAAISCCTPDQAWGWVDSIAELALAGDKDAPRGLPAAVDHVPQAVWEVVHTEMLDGERRVRAAVASRFPSVVSTCKGTRASENYTVCRRVVHL